MCFTSAVRLAYFLLWNDILCYVSRCLNVAPVSPMHLNCACATRVIVGDGKMCRSIARLAVNIMRMRYDRGSLSIKLLSIFN